MMNGFDHLSAAMATGGTPYTVETLASAFAIACRAVVSDIECGGVRVGSIHERCYDVRCMVDEREHAPETIDMAREALAFAVAMRLIERDERAPHLVRIVRMPV